MYFNPKKVKHAFNITRIYIWKNVYVGFKKLNGETHYMMVGLL